MKTIISIALCALLSCVPVPAQNNNAPGAGLTRNVVYVNSASELVGALNRAKNDTTIFVSPGNYSINASNNVGSADPMAAPMRIIGKTNVSVVGYKSRLVTTGSGQSFIVASNCQNLTIDGLTLDGLNFGYSSNGLNGIMGAIEFAGTNSDCTVRNCTFNNIGGFGVVLGYRPTQIDKHLGFALVDSSAYNCGITNGGSINGNLPDGGLFAGSGDNLRVSRCSVRYSTRAVELFTSNPATNISISDIVSEGVLESVVCVTPNTGITINNLALLGGTNYPVAYLPGTYTQTGVYIQDQNANIQINSLIAHALKGRAVWLNTVGSGSISNVQVNAAVIAGGGIVSTVSGGIILNDNSGNGVIDGVYIRSCSISDNMNQAVDILGGRRVYVENNSFTDCGTAIGGTEVIRLSTGAGAYDSVSNVVIRNNLFQNYGTANRATYAVSTVAQALNTRIIDNVITNMATGAISDSSASTTIIGEPFSYSVVTNLGSFAAGSSSNIFIPAPLSRTAWDAQVSIPAGFFGVSGGLDVQCTSFCTNGSVVVNVRNVGAGTFDPPSSTIKAIVRASGAY